MTRSTQLFVFLFLSPRSPLYRAPTKINASPSQLSWIIIYKNEYYLHLYVKCKYMFCFDLFTGRNGIRLSWRSSRPRLWRRPWKGAGCFPPSSSFKIHLFITFNTWPFMFLLIPHLFAKRSSGVILYKLLRNCFDALFR